MHPVSRRAVLSVAATTAVGSLAGCLNRLGSEPSGTATGVDATDRPGVDDSSAGVLPLADEALPLRWATPTLRRRVVDGGVGVDGIQSIDTPVSFDAEVGDRRLKPGDPVFGLAVDGVARAYPQNVLVWHEIVNDTVAGHPLAVTYCPLTGSALAFDRGETTFGVSGDLLNNNLVMYDRATDSRWPQLLATAISGPFEGASLRERRLVWTTWERWRTLHPDTDIIFEDTDYVRSYDQDPYGRYNPVRGYYASNGTLFEHFPVDGDAHLKSVVLGVRTERGAVAAFKSRVTTDRVVADEDLGVVFVYDDALDTGFAYRTGRAGEYRTDGDSVEGPTGNVEPDSLPETPLPAFDAMWFAWAGFYPEATVLA